MSTPIEVPPTEALRRMPIVTFIKLAIRVGIVAMERRVLEHVIPEVLEEVPVDSDSLRELKYDLDRVEGFSKAILDKRIQYELWPIDTGPVVAQGIDDLVGKWLSAALEDEIAPEFRAAIEAYFKLIEETCQTKPPTQS